VDRVHNSIKSFDVLTFWRFGVGDKASKRRGDLCATIPARIDFGRPG
jgi:hypothetical protein